MKLSISNIAWDSQYDKEIYNYMKEYNYTGLEIAPTRIVNCTNPYTKENVEKATNNLKDVEFNIVSMQSILYGRNEKLFGSDDERKILLDYLYSAIDYAGALGCKNLVFGSPKNRIINDIKKEYRIAVDFFSKLSSYAETKDVIIAIEANPKIYGTNFINDTYSAYQFVMDTACSNIKINYDLGTVIINDEKIDDIEKYFQEINHVHISEPYLDIIKKNTIHKRLFEILQALDYDKFVSIEMKMQNSVSDIKDVLYYVSSLCN